LPRSFDPVLNKIPHFKEMQGGRCRKLFCDSSSSQWDLAMLEYRRERDIGVIVDNFVVDGRDG
jgi:hypothetical protein